MKKTTKNAETIGFSTPLGYSIVTHHGNVGYKWKRFKELYPKYGYGDERSSGSKQEVGLDEWDWDLYSESQEHLIEEIKAKEANTEAIEVVNEVPDASAKDKENVPKNEEKSSKKTKRIQKEKQSYSDYDKKMMEQGKKGFDYMYEKESEFLRLRDEALDKLLTEKFNVGAIKAYLYIWRMAYKHKYNSLHWTASTNEIAKEISLSPNTVSTGLEQLEKRGLIKIEGARHERSSLTYIIQPLA